MVIGPGKNLQFATMGKDSIMNLLSLLSIGAFFIYASLGIYSIHKQPRFIINRVFFLLSAALAIWAFAYAFVYSSPEPASAWTWFWFKLSSWGWVTLPALFLHMAVALTGPNRRVPPIFYLCYLIPVVELYQVYHGVLTASGFVSTSLGMAESISYSNPWFWLHSIYYFGYPGAAFIITYRWGRRSPLVREKKQACLIIISGILVLCGGIVMNLILPATGILFPAIAPIIGLIWAGAILVAITKYRFISLTPDLLADKILEKVTDLIFILSPQFNILRINQAALNIIGGQKKEWLNQKFLPLLLDPDHLTTTIYSLIDNQRESQTIDLQIFSESFAAVPVRATVSVVTDQFGDLIGLVLVGQDMRLTRQLQDEIHERKLAEEKLRFLSLHDALTGLYNRAFLEDELARLQNNGSLGVLMCDLDGLKLINDTLGHSRGDQALVEVAQIIENAVGSNGIAARIGGDEFAILVPGTDEQYIRNLADQIRNAVQALTVLPLPVGISIGYSLVSNRTAVNEGLHLADMNMYRDKTLRKKLSN